MGDIDIEVVVNGDRRSATVPARLTLADFLRDRCGLTGTHLGCEHGACGACTVLLDGEAVRACLMFAVQADGRDVTTIEGLGGRDGGLSDVQSALRDHHGLQCGFCTPGVVVSVTAFLRDNPNPTDDEIRCALSGNLCRCTGYQGIIAAVRSLAGSPSAPRGAHRGPPEAQISAGPTRRQLPARCRMRALAGVPPPLDTTAVRAPAT